MTAKRFVDYFNKDHNYIIQDLQNEDEYQVGFVNCDEDLFLELVNKLNEENEQLRFDFKEMKGLLHSLEEENEQLKAINKHLIEILEYNGTTIEIEKINGDVE